MKILHVLNSELFSGAENVVANIISGVKDDCSFEMAYCSPFSKNVEQSLQKRGIVYYSIPSLKIKNLKKIIHEFKPDIIHAHDMRASFISALSCGNIPLVSHIHNNAFNARNISFKSIAYYYAAKKAKHIFWVSKSSFNGYIFSNKLKNKSTVLYNVLDLDHIKHLVSLDSNEYDYDIIFLGRLTHQKNPCRFLDICNNVKKLKDNVRIVVVGWGDMENEVKQKAAEMKLLNNIVFLGYVSNPMKILSCSKVLVMTSYWEGTPMSALEAQALGIPIVSTPVDGMLDLVHDGENGFLTDDNDVFSNKIVECITNKDIWDKLSNNQIILSKKWNDITTFLNKIKKVYGELYDD